MPEDVSLVVATYRRHSRIAPTLQSALDQTVPFAEIVVVDDCSPDRSAEWIRTHFPTVRVISTPRNLMTSGARNFGAAEAKSPWLMFLDHDDLLRPYALQALLELARAFPEAGALHADHSYENRATGEHFADHHVSMPAFKRLADLPVVRRSPEGRLYDRALFYALLSGNLLQQPWMVRRSVFVGSGGFCEDIRYCEDWELYTRIARDHGVAITDRVVSSHVVEASNLHLVDGQEVMHQRVLRRRLAEHPFDFMVQLVCRRRLGGYAKMDGDRAKESGEMYRAWRSYARSCLWWPLDYVVAARCIGWLPQAMVNRRHQ